MTEHKPASSTPPAQPRVVLFTDTLGDVNGVSRFIQNVATVARERGLALDVITSTRFATPPWPNIHNLAPRFARAMPRYPQLEIAWPPRRQMHELAARLGPTVVHISTPGPVGMAGRAFARRHGLPIVGVYHTDFPAYIQDLFRLRPCTWVCRRFMRWFYRPFALVFTRSQEYAASLKGIGIGEDRVAHLLPGIDLSLFNPMRRDEEVWPRVGEAGLAAPEVVKVLYVGRVSVEKNLPLLAQAWPETRRQCVSQGIDARLIVVGDGPYRAAMQAALGSHGAHFLGFRHGEELASLYASGDLFVFPSITDTLGQAVMEAQACALPAIVSDVGGPKEIVQHQRTGLVVSSQAPGEWASAMTRLVMDHAARVAMGQAAAHQMRSSSIQKSFDDYWSRHVTVGQRGPIQPDPPARAVPLTPAAPQPAG